MDKKQPNSEAAVAAFEEFWESQDAEPSLTGAPMRLADFLIGGDIDETIGAVYRTIDGKQRTVAKCVQNQVWIHVVRNSSAHVTIRGGEEALDSIGLSNRQRLSGEQVKSLLANCGSIKQRGRCTIERCRRRRSPPK